MTVRMEAILPSVDPATTVQAYARRLARAFDEIERLLMSDLEKTVESWRSRPRFRFDRRSNLRSAEIFATTTSRVWHWLDGGTRAHLITARRDGEPLRFSGHPPESGPPYAPTYQAGTTPNRLSSVPPVDLGSTVVDTYAVIHPGVEARNWSRLIREDRIDDFTRILRDALLRDFV